MKHIKIFEKFNDINSLEEFCNENLINLIDAGFKLEIKQQTYTPGVLYIILSKVGKNKYQNWFVWDDVKDDYIPFLEVLSTKYSIKEIMRDDVKSSIILITHDSNNRIVDLKDVDKYSSDDHIINISVTVKL